MSDVITDSPVVVNDTGTGRDGTRVDETWYAALLAAINVQTLSATNPTVTPASTIDEVVAARGSIATLDGRLDVEHNNDGTHKSTGVLATFITEAQLMGGLGGVNLIRNDDFLLWPSGDAAAPLYWPVTGAGATVARVGTALGDTSRKVGDFACKLTRAGTNCYIRNSLLAGSGFTRADFLKGKYLAFGCWVKCSTNNIARVSVTDGVSTSYSGYHAGDGNWQFLAITRQIDSSATLVAVSGHVDNSDGAAIFSGADAILVNGDMDLVQYQPSPVQYGALKFGIAGNLPAALSRFDSYEPARAGIVKDIQCSIKTPGTGRAVIFDVNTWDGATLTTMCTTKPQIADGLARGGVQPDGDYARRCLSPTFGTTIGAGGLLTVDLDQNGSGTVGADASVMVRVLQYATPLERFYDYNQ